MATPASAKDKKKSAEAAPQNLTLRNREWLSVTGVLDVESFQEHTVLVATELGRLLIKGAGLKVKQLNPETAELTVTGEIRQLIYVERKKHARRPSWWGGVI